MGTLNTTGMDFSPVNITPPGAVNNPQTQEIFRPATTYPEPAHLVFLPLPAPWARAGYDVKNGSQPYLCWGPSIQPNNDQIVTAPDSQADQGTWVPNYTGSGVALQDRNTITQQAVFGQAPTSGVYTGSYADGCG